MLFCPFSMPMSSEMLYLQLGTICYGLVHIFTTKYLVRRFWLKGSDIINDMFDTISQFVWATQEINHLGFEG